MYLERILKNKESYLKLKQIFAEGYIPCRKFDNYHDDTTEFVGNFGHAVFNLSENLLKEFSKQDRNLFSFDKILGHCTPSIAEERFFDIVKLYDLSIKKICKNHALDEKSWKVALYVDEFGCDCYFLKEEEYGVWTHKPSFYQNIILEDKLPLFINSDRNRFKLENIYCISNEKA